MLPVNALPTPGLKVFAAVARWALWLLVAAWVTLGLVWGGLHFLIVPRISEFRPWLEQQASQRMGITVRVGDILATSNGLIPSIELRDVRLLDATGREALRLPSVLAALSVRSALGRGFEQLYVAAPELEVRRSADGRIWVAGFLLPDAQSDGGSAADWVFAQTELVLRQGRLRWTDELRGLPTLELSDVDVLVRNRRRAHTFRLDADPPAGWGTRLTLQGQFEQPLFAGRAGDWRNWSGQFFAQATQIDLAQLHNYVGLGFDLRQGAGSLRAWLDVDHAQVLGGTADLALQTVTVQLASDLAPLHVAQVNGRLGLRRLSGGYEVSAQALSFDTGDGLHWPGGNLRLSLLNAQGDKAARGTLDADRLDLAALAEVASRLPLNVDLHSALQRLAPQGQVEKLMLGWEGSSARPTRYTARGRVTALALAAQPLGAVAADASSGTGKSDGKSAGNSERNNNSIGTPGLQGAAVDFDLHQDGGRASVSVQNGSVDFPGIFEQPQVALEALSADLTWKVTADQISVESNRLRFANTDAQGEAKVRWHTAAVPRGGAPALRFPGVLDLNGSLSRVNLAAVPRYLPLQMDPDARAYLAQALVAGAGSNASFKVRGDLAKFPFESAQQGELRVSAALRNASYAYAPALVLPKDSPPWPLLTQVDGELLLDQDRLQIKAARGLLAGGTALQFSKTEVVVSKLFDAPLVAVTAEARGPLAEALAFVNASPVGGWIGNALAQSSVAGNADYKLRLSLPVLEPEKATAQGSVTLANGDFQFAPTVPRVSRARGVLAFTESGFSLAGVQGRALGGDVRLDGALNFAGAGLARSGPGALRMQGVATAEGLRLASELGPVARLAQFATGSASYSATLGLRAGEPELVVNSNLTGLALSLPPPLAKPADALLPLRLERSLVRASLLPGARLQDQWQVALGKLASAVYVRDISGAEPVVLRGAVGVGLGEDESAPMPAEGVAANLKLEQLDVDAWTAVAARLDTPATAAAGSAKAAAAAPSAATDYLPSSVVLRTGQLLLQGRSFHQVLLGGGRSGLVWRGNVNATELSGYLEYRQSSDAVPGRVYARLAHLVLAPSAAADVENLLDQQPASIPALDVVVEDMELRGKKLGRVEISAVNLGLGARDGARDGLRAGEPGAVREWRLNRFNISSPDATLTASGNWALVNAQSAAPPVSVKPLAPLLQAAPPAPITPRERRRTALNFKLDVADSGDLLKRFGMPGVIAKGKGKIEGQVSWLGAPFSPDYASMGGGFNINMESGQFLKADPGIAKLLGVLSLQSLPRRLTLDFRDVFSDGFAFDFVRGDVVVEQGMARTGNLQMKGVNAAVMMEGQADIARETQSIKVVVIPEINVASASLLYSAINPLVGLTTFLANVLLRGPLVNANTQQFLVDGTWTDPRVTQVERFSELPPLGSPTATP